MRIAVAYNNGEIGEHFGHAETFAFYDYDLDSEDLTECRKYIVDVSDRHGHQEMADLMREQAVDAVIVGNMGGEAKACLLGYGIVPVAGYCGDADTAADLLITGQLPIVEGGSCSGGCGGCSGCGGHEGGDCGCGGGCGCGE